MDLLTVPAKEEKLECCSQLEMVLHQFIASKQLRLWLCIVSKESNAVAVVDVPCDRALSVTVYWNEGDFPETVKSKCEAID